MPSPLDLTNIDAVNNWLGITNNTSAVQLGQLITAVSRVIYATLARPSLLPRTLTERYDGQGNTRMFLKNYPVLNVSQVLMNGLVVQASTPPTENSPATFGWLLDPWDGTPPGRNQPLDFIYGCWWRGPQNIQVTYQCGYGVVGEAQNVPESPGPYTITPIAPYGPWWSNIGVAYASNNAPLTLVTGAPSAGQYSISEGVYTFSAADAGAAVLLGYGFVPQDIFEIATELVGERFTYKQRIGVVSKSLGGQETMSYSQRDIPAWCMSALAPYRQTMVPV